MVVRTAVLLVPSAQTGRGTGRQTTSHNNSCPSGPSPGPAGHRRVGRWRRPASQRPCLLEASPRLHSSSLTCPRPGASMPKKEDGRPWTSRSLFTKAEKEETQFPMKWSAFPRTYRSVWAESGCRLTTFTWKQRQARQRLRPDGDAGHTLPATPTFPPQSSSMSLLWEVESVAM